MGSIHHHLKSSMLYGELHSLPLFKSLGEAYSRMKESSRLVAGGLTVLEYSCTSVLDKLYDGSSVAKGVDEMAGKGVARLIDTYPALTQSPEELQEKTSSALKQTVRRAMKTPPGQVLLQGLDWAIDRTEGLLKAIKPKKAASSPRKKKLTRSALGKQHLGSKDHAYALDDSGACDSDTRLMMTPQAGDIPAAVARLAGSEQTVMDKVFRLACILPLEVTVASLKATRRYVGGKRKRTTQGGDLRSPTSRRKVSPRKKMSTSFLGKMKHRAFGLLGYTESSKKIHIEELHGLGSPGKDDDDDKHEKKRKHEEILTDPDSDSGDSADDIENFDFDAYDSGEDPDYQPTDESDPDTDLSDESDADTESDVEVEPVGKSLVALKHGCKEVNVVAKDTKVIKKDVKINNNDSKTNGMDGKTEGKNVVVNGKDVSSDCNAKIEDFDIISGDKGAKQDKGGQKNAKNDTPKPGPFDDFKQKVLVSLSPKKSPAEPAKETVAKAPETKTYAQICDAHGSPV